MLQVVEVEMKNGIRRRQTRRERRAYVSIVVNRDHVVGHVPALSFEAQDQVTYENSSC